MKSTPATAKGTPATSKPTASRPPRPVEPIVPVPREILHVLDECECKGILNRECEVLPPGSNKAAIPEDATHNTISFP